MPSPSTCVPSWPEVLAARHAWYAVDRWPESEEAQQLHEVYKQIAKDYYMTALKVERR
jgi:hypothetical protein